MVVAQRMRTIHQLISDGHSAQLVFSFSEISQRVKAKVIIGAVPNVVPRDCRTLLLTSVEALHAWSDSVITDHGHTFSNGISKAQFWAAPVVSSSAHADDSDSRKFVLRSEAAEFVPLASENITAEKDLTPKTDHCNLVGEWKSIPNDYWQTLHEDFQIDVVSTLRAIRDGCIAAREIAERDTVQISRCQDASWAIGFYQQHKEFLDATSSLLLFAPTRENIVKNHDVIGECRSLLMAYALRSKTLDPLFRCYMPPKRWKRYCFVNVNNLKPQRYYLDQIVDILRNNESKEIEQLRLVILHKYWACHPWIPHRNRTTHDWFHILTEISAHDRLIVDNKLQALSDMQL
jgi:hypothetical protein